MVFSSFSLESLRCLIISGYLKHSFLVHRLFFHHVKTFKYVLEITGLQINERDLQGVSPSPSKSDLSSLVAHFEFSLLIWQT